MLGISFLSVINLLSTLIKSIVVVLDILLTSSLTIFQVRFSSSNFPEFYFNSIVFFNFLLSKFTLFLTCLYDAIRLIDLDLIAAFLAHLLIFLICHSW